MLLQATRGSSGAFMIGALGMTDARGSAVSNDGRTQLPARKSLRYVRMNAHSPRLDHDSILNSKSPLSSHHCDSIIIGYDIEGSEWINLTSDMVRCNI